MRKQMEKTADEILGSFKKESQMSLEEMSSTQRAEIYFERLLDELRTMQEYEEYDEEIRVAYVDPLLEKVEECSRMFKEYLDTF